MIVAAYIFLALFCGFCFAGIGALLLLGIAWIVDRYYSRGWRRASEQQRRTILEIKL